jgi:hypothetical protein
MKKLLPWLAAVCLVGLGGVAHADRWDSTGWVKLGAREVNGRVDHDTIEVGRYEGKFTKLTLYVEKSDLELLDFEVTFGNGERWHPEVRHVFKEGARTRVIDLPGDDRVIKNINLKYKNLPGGGRAAVEVWGWKDTGGGHKTFSWDNAGWTMLGEREVNGHGREDHDRIEVGRHEGAFTKLTVVVLDSDLEMIDFEIKFGNGETWHPGMSYFFKEGGRTRVLDFPGNKRIVKFIDFKYRNLPGGGRAKVQVWAK